MPDHDLDELHHLEDLALSILATIRRFIAYYEHRPRRHLRAVPPSLIIPAAIAAAWQVLRRSPRYAALASSIGTGAIAVAATAGIMAMATPPCQAQAVPPPVSTVPAPPGRTPSPSPHPDTPATTTRPPTAMPPATGVPTAQRTRTPAGRRPTQPTVTVTATGTRASRCRRDIPPGLRRICLRIESR